MLIELLTAALFGSMFWLIAPLGIAEFVRYGLFAFLLSALIVATFIDLDFQIIPDSVTVPGMFVGLVGSTFIPQVPLVLVTAPGPAAMAPTEVWIVTLNVVVYGAAWIWGLVWLVRSRDEGLGAAEWVIWCVAALYLTGQTFNVLVVSGVLGQGWPGWSVWFIQHPHWQGFCTAVIGLLTGAGLIWTVRVLGSAAMGREAMGFGDVTLMAMVGAFMGWQACVCVFFLAPFMGLAFGLFQWIFRGNNVLPYGPYLSLATVATVCGWPIIWPILAPRLAILGMLPILWGGIAMLTFLCILVSCVRIHFRQQLASEPERLGPPDEADPKPSSL
jgi:prepilin signal peptidase PulO-like enzyme (type II secretory pathway)